ncbi:ATP-binding protein [Marinilabiliaceae bacterium ANBcel2]|nr:ATP-binding protein [Marinilabiliaceae bacterium ANBcel2]
MSYKIAVVSGKGGTGKTAFSISLFNFLRSNLERSKVTIVDCDVEEPNISLFLKDKTKFYHKLITQDVAVIDEERCKFCKKCSDYCAFNAIVVIPRARYAKVDSSLCHSCGACYLACNYDAIGTKQYVAGEVDGYKISSNSYMYEGRLKVGSPMQTFLIGELKKELPQDDTITIYDSPPGTSCSVVETLSGSDFVIIVAEPTAFGIHDMLLVRELADNLDKPCGIVLNKVEDVERAVEYIPSQHRNDFLGALPYSVEFAWNYACGELSYSNEERLKESYFKIFSKLFINEGADCFKR